MTGYRVDLAELDAVVERLTRLAEATRVALDDVSVRVSALPWEGTAAEAHRAAQSAWSAGAREMAVGVETMRDAARRAHSSYTAALESNSRMFGRD
ncbi:MULTISPECIES: WXG100 family type VII secretion target [unclassified Rhodococcus (in: high G+C Gram-positive bacteria)]|uniref:WXG100 family type VII secretion target n=1 Tax=unclassified Rhodococcus (in: high G+C Gram-positive bacteria) TaxID=192944 RepID=UPI0027DEF83D|nr:MULTISPECIES: WXG100 family type VII secretion target [unclassified Rhodococcus (in: high G+C Gram-positive bacteria)]